MRLSLLLLFVVGCASGGGRDPAVAPPGGLRFLQEAFRKTPCFRASLALQRFSADGSSETTHAVTIQADLSKPAVFAVIEKSSGETETTFLYSDGVHHHTWKSVMEPGTRIVLDPFDGRADALAYRIEGLWAETLSEPPRWSGIKARVQSRRPVFHLGLAADGGSVDIGLSRGPALNATWLDVPDREPLKAVSIGGNWRVQMPESQIVVDAETGFFAAHELAIGGGRWVLKVTSFAGHDGFSEPTKPARFDEVLPSGEAADKFLKPTITSAHLVAKWEVIRKNLKANDVRDLLVSEQAEVAALLTAFHQKLHARQMVRGWVEMGMKADDLRLNMTAVLEKTTKDWENRQAEIRDAVQRRIDANQARFRTDLNGAPHDVVTEISGVLDRAFDTANLQRERTKWPALSRGEVFLEALDALTIKK